MILKLPFKKVWYYKEKPIEILLRLGTLEDLCEDLKIEFWQIKDYMLKNEFDFSHLLLYYGYVMACNKRGQLPKYTKTHAALWLEYMSATEKKKYIEGMTELFGKVVKSYRAEKSKKKE
jgi:hypothetical protein